MQQQKEVIDLIKNYEDLFPEEIERITNFREFVFINKDNNLYSRKNFSGHITTSGAIINQVGSHILLLKHKQLNKWLLPGGHIELEDATILDATYREIKEETNIDISQLVNLSFYDDSLPIEMDSHLIPANLHKQEVTHFHHDFRYVFLYLGEEGKIKIDKSESTDIKWIKISELINNEIFSNMLPKIEKLLSYRSSFLNKT